MLCLCLMIVILIHSQQLYCTLMKFIPRVSATSYLSYLILIFDISNNFKNYWRSSEGYFIFFDACYITP